MRFLTYIFIVLFLGSCATRKVENTKTRLAMVDRGTVERTSPGDVIFLPAPRIPNERKPLEVYKGERGAKASLSFDENGALIGGVVNCPEVSELEKKNLELDYQNREKNSDRAFNEMALKEIKSTVIWLTLIVSLAWVARGFVLKR